MSKPITFEVTESKNGTHKVTINLGPRARPFVADGFTTEESAYRCAHNARLKLRDRDMPSIITPPKEWMAL